MPRPSRTLLSRAAPADRLLTFALALLFAPDCTAPGEAESDQELAAAAAAENRGVLLSAAVWTFDWDTQGVTFSEQGGFDVDTDLGYRVHVTRGRIVTHSVALAPSDPGFLARNAAGPGHRRRGAPDVGHAPRDSHEPLARRQAPFGLPIRSARAHTEGTDPSSIEPSLIEDLLAPHATEVASSFPAVRYCEAHWLLARPMTATSGPAEIPMENRSLYLTGTFERGGRRVAFTVDTWWPQGLLVDLAAAIPPADYEAARESAEVHHAFLTVTRPLAGLFDGIDFEVASEDQVAGTVIDNLVSGSSIHGALWSPGASD